MDFEWVAIALGDVTWISVAFFLGFMATGFVLNSLGITRGETFASLCCQSIAAVVIAFLPKVLRTFMGTIPSSDFLNPS